jgi:hypothetical protein
MLILATLHLAALRGHPELGPFYEAARSGQLDDPEGAARGVLEVVHDAPEIVREELWRSTQTNEPGRSAVIQALVADLVAGDSVAINVIDVGTSAGINLCFDQFPVRERDDGNPLTLVCEDRTAIDRSSALPRVIARVGIDLNPLDLERRDDRLWLKACLWPEERRRHERFDAIVVARPSWPAATILEGRALDRLEDALALSDPAAMTIVMDTWAAFYFTPEERLDYFARLSRSCLRDNVAWISIDSPMTQWPGLEVDNHARRRGASQIVLTRPRSSPRRWGWCHAHGRWLEQITTS